MRGCLTIYVHTQTAVEEPGGVSPELVHPRLFPDVQGWGGLFGIMVLFLFSSGGSDCLIW